MKKVILIFLSLLVISSHAYSANMTKTETRISINDGTTNVEDTGIITKYFSTGVTQQQTATLSTGFNNISIPSGAKGLFIDVGSSTNMILKGVTADKGISLDSTCPVMFPLSADGSTTVGITNMGTSSQTVKLYFF